MRANAGRIFVTLLAAEGAAAAQPRDAWSLVIALERDCLADTRAVERLDGGRLAITVTIAGGKVARAMVSDDTTGSPRFARCIIARLDDAHIPDGTPDATLQFDWTLAPGPEGPPAPNPLPPAPKQEPPAPAPPRSPPPPPPPDVKPSPEVTRLLRHAPREVREALSPTARFVSHSQPFGFDFDAWYLYDVSGHRVATFTGAAGRADRWLYYPGDEWVALTDNDGDGIADERSRELYHGEARDWTRVYVRRAGRWQLHSVTDYRVCSERGQYKETIYRPDGRTRTTWSSCIVS